MTYIRSITFGALRRLMATLGCREERIGDSHLAFIHPDDAHDFIYMIRRLADGDTVPVQLLAGLGSQIVAAGLDSWHGFEVRLANAR